MDVFFFLGGGGFLLVALGYDWWVGDGGWEMGGEWIYDFFFGLGEGWRGGLLLVALVYYGGGGGCAGREKGWERGMKGMGKGGEEGGE